MIYSYQAAGKAEVHTLRLDSAFMIGTDSVYRFNRIMRPDPASSGLFHKSDNNLFGAQLRFVPGSQEVVLEALADALQTPVQMLLRPAAAVGSTWQASMGVTAVLSSRSQQSVHGVWDNVATVLLSTGQQVLIGEELGLLQAPQWLSLDAATASNLQATRVPVTWAESDYYPAHAFDFQPGDEFGYEQYDWIFSLPCAKDYILRRISSRGQTQDSLKYTYQEERATRGYGLGSPCNNVYAETLHPRTRGRMAVSLKTGQWADKNHPPLSLLTWEYQKETTVSGLENYTLALPLSTEAGATLPGPKYIRVYKRDQAYATGMDYLAHPQRLSAPVGMVYDNDTWLVYYHRRLPDGTYSTFGTRQQYEVLLPVRAARSSLAVRAYPNPATGVVTLDWVLPAVKGAKLSLTDLTGRALWQAEPAAGSTQLQVPLAAYPAGLYLLRLEQPGKVPVMVRVQH
ncbi:T9SS type A sorting domain-containing protein [Hymenobacter sp. BT730]|uniref:T9SS type A sorting domain-containing protein n=1 Tax=Hymenobacter sp. BT730 TaxID=3063332 RepID=UPI0026E0502B|nr:T9SS type A sorting domain-containing protein [Hymenobacter sp. BT730]